MIKISQISKYLVLVLFLLPFCLSLNVPIAQAGVSPLGFSLIGPIEFPPSDFTITGARLSILWGQTRSVYGIDLGVVGNITEQDFVGIGVSGIFNLNKGESTIIGLQAAGITNINVNKTHIYGVQVAAGLNSNQAESTLVGLEVALGNYAPFTHVVGAQLGIYNRAQKVTGFQIGLINSTEVLQGIQIGLLNFNHQGLFAVSPILNIGF